MSSKIIAQVANLDDERPVPERVAAHYGFPLAFHDVDSIRRYSVQDWIVGVGKTENPRAFWSQFKKRLKRLGIELSTRCLQLPYKSANGKTYRMDHADAETLYLITQRMEAGNGNRDAVLQYLAMAGVILDAMVRNPDQAAAAFSDLADEKERRKLLSEGFSEKEADQWLKVRRELKEENKRLTTEWKQRGISRGKDYGRLTNEVSLRATGMSATELKHAMAIKRTPRDYQSAADNVKIQIVSVTSRSLHSQRDSYGVSELSEDISDVQPIIDAARDEIDRVFSQKPRRLPRGNGS